MNSSSITPKDYFNDDGSLKEDLFVETAKKIAESFRPPQNEKKGVKVTQIRKFYDEVLRLKLKIDSIDSSNDSQEKQFKKILPYIKMLIPKVIYAKSKGTVNETFKDFIESNIKGLTSLKEFNVFCDLFEAVVAYCK